MGRRVGPRRVAQYKHRDEASNTVFELSSKDFGLRAEILEVQLKDGKLPKLEVSQVPLPGFDEADDEIVEPEVENSGLTSPRMTHKHFFFGDTECVFCFFCSLTWLCHCGWHCLAPPRF